MLTLKAISIEELDNNTLLEELKQYASVPDGSRDALLRSLLRTAVLKVQEYADRAFMPTVLELASEADDMGLVHLYEGGGDIVSVTGEDGSSVDFSPVGKEAFRTSYKGVVSCTYRTSPVKGDIDEMKPTVLRYATALYDGEDVAVLNNILNEVL